MGDDIVARIFKKLDADGSGTITKGEMNTVFKTFDKDGNGEVSKEEFSAGFQSVFGGTAEQAAKVFGHLDKDGSGDISMAEVDGLFDLMDEDKNGSVDQGEFTKLWTKLLP